MDQFTEGCGWRANRVSIYVHYHNTPKNPESSLASHGHPASQHDMPLPEELNQPGMGLTHGSDDEDASDDDSKYNADQLLDFQNEAAAIATAFLDQF